MTGFSQGTRRPAACSHAPDFSLTPEGPQDRTAADALVETAFGPGRYAKTAERLREGNRPRADLCFCARSAAELIGSVRLWPLLIGDAAVLFLGPIAVDAAWRKHGVGGALVERACEAARRAGDGAILLVGDPPFFEPLAFKVVPSRRLILPGPVNPARLMWRALRPGATEALAGEVAVPLPSTTSRP